MSKISYIINKNYPLIQILLFLILKAGFYMIIYNKLKSSKIKFYLVLKNLFLNGSIFDIKNY